MNELQVFNYGDIPVRAVMLDNEPWWVLADVCQALSLGSPHKVANRLDLDEKDRNQIPTPGGNQEMTIINESCLYKVILRSNKPEAKRFTRWVTHEVLPAIRKTGTYSMASSAPPAPKLRALTTDDFIDASRIISDCRNERLPYVIGLLEQGGFKFPKVKNVPKPRQTVHMEQISTFEILNLEDFL